jgi:hypothetical protein
MKNKILFISYVILAIVSSAYLVNFFYEFTQNEKRISEAVEKNYIDVSSFILSRLEAFKVVANEISSVDGGKNYKKYISKYPDLYNALPKNAIVSIAVLDKDKKFLYGYTTPTKQEPVSISSVAKYDEYPSNGWLEIDLNGFYHSSRGVYGILLSDSSYLLITFSLDTSLGRLESLSYGFNSFGFIRAKGDAINSHLKVSIYTFVSRIMNESILIQTELVPGWDLVFSGKWLDVAPFSKKEISQVIVALLFLTFFVSASIFLMARLFLPKKTSYWLTTVVFDLFQLVIIVFIFNGYLATSDEIRERTETFRQLTDLWGDENNNTSVIFIPTLIHLESISFLDDASFIITGFISQIYPKDIQIEKGFIFPYESHINPAIVKEISRYEDERSIQIISQFGVQINQVFSPSLFPFDKRHLKINIWPKEVYKNIVFFPNLANYQTFNYSTMPGIGVHVDVNGWKITDSSYLLEKREAYYFFGATNLPVIYQFTVDMERNFLGAFLSNTLAFLLCTIVAFLVLFIPKDSLLDTLFAIISIFVGLIFVAVTNHASLREALQVTSFAYFEYFFVSFYALILVVTIDFILQVGSPEKKNSRRELLALLYWPALFGSFALILILNSL